MTGKRTDIDELVWWREIDTHGYEWEIVLTSDELSPDIQGHDGRTLMPPYRKVLIWAGLRRPLLLETALHEVAHVHKWASEKRKAEYEISSVIPDILPTLLRQGWLPPSLPDGWRPLAAHARHVRYGPSQRMPA
jgi:hypothetical protein